MNAHNNLVDANLGSGLGSNRLRANRAIKESHLWPLTHKSLPPPRGEQEAKSLLRGTFSGGVEHLVGAKEKQVPNMSLPRVPEPWESKLQPQPKPHTRKYPKLESRVPI